VRRATPTTLLLVLLLAAAPTRAAECGGSTPCACGDTLTGEAVLREDLGPCAGNGLVLNGDAILDCRGHTIRGAGRPLEPRRVEADGSERGGRTSGTFGVTLDRTRGAVVRNCKVTGFTYGVEFSGARDSRLVGSEVWKNGDVGARVGYGVHVSRSQGNSIENCVVRESADEGIHIGSGSDRNVVVGNEAYDNSRENYYVLSAAGNRLLRNRGRGAVSANLYMKHATDTVVEGNQFEGRPVVVRGRSARNVFADNLLGGGIKFEPYGDREPEAPTANVIRAGRIRGATTPCVELVEARQNRVEAPKLEGCAGIVARARGRTENDLVGVEFTKIRLDLSGGAALRLLAPLRVEVLGSAGGVVPRAKVEVRDRRGQAVATATSDATGVAMLEVPTHLVNAAGLVPLGPGQLVGRADGYAPGRLALAEPLPTRATLRLPAVGVVPPMPPPPRERRPPPRRKSPPRPTSVP
jgi:parallel beta-helix repeat protein